MLRGEPLFKSIFAPQPAGFYYALLPFYLVSHSLSALRITVLCFALAGLAATYVAGRLIAGELAGLIALLLLTASPLYIQRSAILQADMPAIALMMVALAVMLTATRTKVRRPVSLVFMAGLVFALALGMKLLAAVAIVPLVLCLLFPRPQPVRAWLSFAGGTLIGVVLVMIPALGSPGAAFDDLVRSHLAAGQASHLGLAHNLMTLAQFPDWPLALLALAGGVNAIARRDPRVIIPLGWLAAATLAILVYEPLFPHHLLLLPPALALTAAVGFAGLRSVRPRLESVATGFVLLASALGLLIAFLHAQHTLRPNGHDLGLAGHLRAVSQPGDFVISDNPFAVALADRDIPGPLVDTSHERTAAGLLTVADLDAARVDVYGARIVLADGDRLLGVPGYSDWVKAHFHQVGVVGRNAYLYTVLEETD